MPEYIGKESKAEKYMFWLMVVPAMILLFVVLTQPAWNSKKLIADFESSCEQKHGILIKHEKMFGTEYECSPDFSAGVRQ